MERHDGSSEAVDAGFLWQQVFELEPKTRNTEATTLTKDSSTDTGTAEIGPSARTSCRSEASLMADLLLTHGYFLFEDPKELQIMKPYAPLGILYLCSHLRNQGFDVDVFDTTFSNREALFQHLRTEKPSVIGIYANLMTRGNVVEVLKVAREAGWKTIVGGPEPGAYALEYLQAGADFVVFGEGELTMQDLLEAFRAGAIDSCTSIPGLAYLDDAGNMRETPHRDTDRRSRQPAMARSSCDRRQPLRQDLARRSRQRFS